MSEMIERVRVALQKHQTVYGPDYEGMARAAIEAMREPTDRMTLAGAEGVNLKGEGRWTVDIGQIDSDDAELAYRAMISAALTPSE